MVETLLEKEKLLVTSNFSSSHNVFHGYIALVRQNAVLCGNGLTKNPQFLTTIVDTILENRKCC